MYSGCNLLGNTPVDYYIFCNSNVPIHSSSHLHVLSVAFYQSFLKLDVDPHTSCLNFPVLSQLPWLIPYHWWCGNDF